MGFAKTFYFALFILAVTALIVHLIAMGQNHWKQADAKPNQLPDFLYGRNRTTVGLFTRCEPDDLAQVETCFPNLYPGTESPCFSWTDCQPREYNATCQCDFLPSTKATAACAIIAAIFLGLAVILLFLQSISSSESRILGLLFGFVPLILLFLAFVFMLITLILVGSFLSRDVIHMGDTELGTAQTLSSNWMYSSLLLGLNLTYLRPRVAERYNVRIGSSAGLEIAALILTFFSFVLYVMYVFKIGRA